MDLDATFGASRPIIGMVHLPALPGAPGFDGDFEAVLDRARRDAAALAAGGADAALVENFGDAPFYPDEVPRHVVASMTAAVDAVRDEVDVPVGVNVLRNDAGAALSVAAATGAAFVRVNVHVGARVTDQGVVEGQAHETLRLRDRLDADVAVLADVAVKHSAPLGDVPLEDSFRDLVERGLADGVVVSGAATGEGVDADHLAAVRDLRDEHAPAVPVFAGSGVTRETVADVLAVADGAIVGTAFERDGETARPVDAGRVASLVDAAEK